MAEIKHFKVVASLPSPLEPDSIYYVRVGRGYDQYVTNGVGVIVAYEANSKLDLENKVDKEDGKQLSDENYTLAEKTKLSGIQAGATANATNAQLRDRSTHTGTQAISTVSGLQTALDSKVDDDDARLTDAREWTASLVSQAEAEAGMATTARKWSAQRVKQAFDAAWAAAKAALLDTQNTWSKPQIIRQGIANTALELSIPTAHIVAIKFGSGVDTENPRNIYFGVRADGTLATGPTATLAYAIHTTNTLPIRSANNVLNYIGNGVTLAEDERAALELGPPVTSANANLLPGRNRNITVSGSRTVIGLSQHFGKGAFASMTIRSNSTASRTVTLGGTILNRADYDEQYVVTDTNVLYLEGRYVEHGFIVTYLTMYTMPS